MPRPGLAWPWSSPRLLQVVAPTAAILIWTFAGGGSRDLTCDLSVCRVPWRECQCHPELETGIDATVVRATPCWLPAMGAACWSRWWSWSWSCWQHLYPPISRDRNRSCRFQDTTIYRQTTGCSCQVKDLLTSRLLLLQDELGLCLGLLTP